MRTAFHTRRRRGTSLLEMTIAASIIASVLAVAFPTMNAIGNAGESGRAQTWTQADNRQALLRVSRELMNGSLTATDALGNPRMEVLTGATRKTLTGDVGVTSATHGAPTTAGAGVGDASNYYKTTDGTGSGSRGGTKTGRARSTGMVAATYDAGASRPREKLFTANSRLRFQKILNYSWGADGEPVINWGSWVEYTVQGRNLVRIEGANTVVVSPNCSGFYVERTAANTLLLTLVTEHRASNAKSTAALANSIEVVPKN